MDVPIEQLDPKLNEQIYKLIKELCELTAIRPFDRCIIPEGYTPSKIIVATDGAVSNTGIAIYVQSKADNKPTVCNLLCAFTFISKFSIPVNEARGMTQGTERLTELLLILAIRKEFQRFELEIEFIADSSCCLALLNPHLNINNRTIRNMVQQIRMNIAQARRIFPNATISFYWIDSGSFR